MGFIHIWVCDKICLSVIIKGRGMTHELNTQAVDQLAPFAINDLLPERPALIGEFSPAYEAF